MGSSEQQPSVITIIDSLNERSKNMTSLPVSLAYHLNSVRMCLTLPLHKTPAHQSSHGAAVCHRGAVYKFSQGQMKQLSETQYG
ncbi:hypothetical protein STEG23_033842 [Scotinomys teguina]